MICVNVEIFNQIDRYILKINMIFFYRWISFIYQYAIL